MRRRCKPQPIFVFSIAVAVLSLFFASTGSAGIGTIPTWSSAGVHGDQADTSVSGSNAVHMFPSYQSPDCVPDQYEPNDSFLPPPPNAPRSDSLTLCPGDEDWLSIEVSNPSRGFIIAQLDFAAGEFSFELHDSGLDLLEGCVDLAVDPVDGKLHCPDGTSPTTSFGDVSPFAWHIPDLAAGTYYMHIEASNIPSEGFTYLIETSDPAATNFWCDVVTEIPYGECEALKALHNSTNGDNWANNDGWLQTVTPCSWNGVTCSGGHVTELDLPGNQLNGSLPPELGDLTNSYSLNLNDNPLSGSLPQTLTNLNLGWFSFENTDLCEPTNVDFQAWLAGIPNLQSTGVYCNAAPVAGDDSYVTDRDTPLTVSAPGVLGNDSDPEDDPITADLVTDVAEGSLDLNADGSFTYTPDPGFNGTDTFAYLANDGELDSNEAMATITVNPGDESSVCLFESDGSTGIPDAAVRYYSGGWQDFGVTAADGCVDKEILAKNYKFRVTYGGASIDKYQDVSVDPVVVFETVNASVELRDSSGGLIDSGEAKYYSGGWHTIGTTSGGQVSMELLPKNYKFRMTYGNASVDKYQNISIDPIVVFASGQVVSASGTCTHYYSGGWRDFASGMELLPKTYKFRFSEGIADTYFTIDAGTVNTIH